VSLVAADAGVSFQDGPDHGRVLAFGRDTGGRYGLMEYVVAPRRPNEAEAYGAHRHREIEETFLVRTGALKFLLGETVHELTAGDFVRVPPGVRHGYVNVSGAPVELLVGFHPGGFEELFVTYRTDGGDAAGGAGFMAEGTARYASEFE
jgi:quercetin dioxygenase-like cupin family protein